MVTPSFPSRHLSYPSLPLPLIATASFALIVIIKYNTQTYKNNLLNPCSIAYKCMISGLNILYWITTYEFHVIHGITILPFSVALSCK